MFKSWKQCNERLSRPISAFRKYGSRGDAEGGGDAEELLDGITYDAGFRIDLFVDDCVIVELKSIEELAPVHSKQVLTYLRLLNLPVGLLINFGGATLKEGLQRIVNKYVPTTNVDERLPIPGKSGINLD